MFVKTTTFTLSCLLMTLPVAAQTMLAEIGGLAPGEVAVQGFELDPGATGGEQEVEIVANSLELQWSREKKIALAAAWILAADRREVVWEMDKSAAAGRRGVQEHRYEARLAAGVYEVYYATFPMKSRYQQDDSWWQGARRSIARMFGLGDDELVYEKALAELGVTVRGEGRRIAAAAIEDRQARLRQDALISIAASAADFSAERGFELARPAEVEIYAVGELTGKEGWDYGWIVDADSRERVWTFRHAESEPAGGAGKNRVVRRTLSLPPGRYGVVFVTDGSHSPGDWNALPPHDPAFWGMTLRIPDPEARRYARNWDFRELPGDERVLVELTRLRNGESRTRGIRVTAPTRVQVYAVGEGQEDFGMSDFGWIADARTREKVWTMDYERSEHAGGGAKNRVVDEMVELAPGNYLVRFVTDGSHAYRDWNTDPPNRPERWGITLFAADQGADRSVVTDYQPADDPAILAQITHVRSASHEQKEFELESDTRVWVYALGEGLEGEMYDYGWLEEAASGRVVWEMSYPDTDSAGGASKNRLYRGSLELGAGRYRLHYRTDDSHAYREWNAPPPADPEAWGIQVARLEGKP